MCQYVHYTGMGIGIGEYQKKIKWYLKNGISASLMIF